jgi:hypothetical protein
VNKRVLIISPYFPPTNAADMQRVRISLPYFANFGWDAEVVTVDEQYANLTKDALLLQSIPPGIKIHRVKALNPALAKILGMGGIALRSLWYYKKAVSRLLKNGRYDLVYFSTTQFPVCILGAYWKKHYGTPYVIDMQDPWHSDYYQDKPKEQQPSKYWLSYRVNKYLEPKALKKADGLISVSQAYIDTLKQRYPVIQNIPAATITFGYLERDLEIAQQNQSGFPSLLDAGSVNIVYVGRGGADMHKAITPVFQALQYGLKVNPDLYSKLKLHFIGTSYIPSITNKQSISLLAREYDIQDQVVEITERISYYHALSTLQQADALFIPGSDDAQYTASKIYPYLLTKKPLLAIFHPDSSAVDILRKCAEQAIVLTLNDNIDKVNHTLSTTLENWANHIFMPIGLTEKMADYNAKNLTCKQCELFNQVLTNVNQ